MNTFFISPLIPLKFYIIIQKEKNNPLLKWNNDQLNFINNINILFDYSNILSEKNRNIITSIIEQISDTIKEYEEIDEKLVFVSQDTFKEITNYNYIYYD